MDRYSVNVRSDGWWSVFDKKSDQLVLERVGKTEVEDFLDFQENIQRIEKQKEQRQRSWFFRFFAA